MKLTVTEIQRFCMHDGPGIRTTVFLKGCSLRCAWCHNPETQKKNSELLFYSKKCIGCMECVACCPNHAHIVEKKHTVNRQSCTLCGSCAQYCPSGALEICGKELGVEEIISVVEKDRAFYRSNGGVTLSGGEPFLQGKATVALLRTCKERGISTAVETCGYADFETISSAIPYTDLFLWDIKDTNDHRHRQYTGVSHQKILDHLKKADALGAKIRIRCILVNGINTDDAHYRAVAQIANSLSHCEGVELMPYHAYGGAKVTFLGLPDNGKAEWIPSALQLDHAKQDLLRAGVYPFI